MFNINLKKRKTENIILKLNLQLNYLGKRAFFFYYDDISGTHVSISNVLKCY